MPNLDLRGSNTAAAESVWNGARSGLGPGADRHTRGNVGLRRLLRAQREPAPANWAARYQRLALEHPISAERQGRGAGGTSLGGVLSIFGFGAGALVGLNTWSAWQRGDWSTVILLIVGLLAAGLLGLAAYPRFGLRELHDPKLVREKFSAMHAASSCGRLCPEGATPRKSDGATQARCAAGRSEQGRFRAQGLRDQDSNLEPTG